MGGHHSKRHHRLVYQDVGQWRGADGGSKPWELVHTCTITEWAKSEATHWGFDPNINYLARPHQRTQPWASKGRLLTATIPAPETQDIDMPADQMYATMAINERKNNFLVETIDLPFSYFEQRSVFIEIIAFKDDYMVIQIATETRIDLYLIDTRTYIPKRIYHEEISQRPCLYEAAVSPDGKRVVFRQNSVYAKMHEIEQTDDVLRIVELDTEGEAVGSRILLQGNALEVMFVFDPKYRHSHLALANIKRGEYMMLSIVDEKTMVSLVETELVTMEEEKHAQKLEISPGGAYLAALMRFGELSSSPPFYLTDVILYHTDTLHIAYVIRQPVVGLAGYGELTPSAIFPMFSESGEYLAVGIGTVSDEGGGPVNRLTSVAVHRVPAALNLMFMCRTKIRNWVPGPNIKYLPLPDALKRFIMYIPTEN